MGQKCVKNAFFQVIVDLLGCSNKGFSPILSPWWRVLARPKSQKALKMGPLKSKRGEKMVNNAFCQK